MPVLNDYDQFDGLHWETGSVRNFYAYRGVTAPHTGQPYSDALLMGIGGGVVMAYFSFAYEGYDPHVAILTRNTFDPMNSMLERLGVVQTILHTGKPDKAVANLVDTLESSTPAIVWADMFSLPYNALPYDKSMWGMAPIIVYGYDESADTVWIADRSSVALTVTTAELAAARARVKKDKFRILTLDPPHPDKLTSAIQKGIWDCIKLFTEAPPKGSKNNFGFAAYRRWADLLVKPKQKMSWEREFPAGLKMLAGLTSTFERITPSSAGSTAERDLYAVFLEEAGIALARPALKDVAQQFRASADAWHELGIALLPDAVAPFRETRELLLQKMGLFYEQGGQALPAIRDINRRLDAIKAETAADFPLVEHEVVALRESLREHVLKIHDLEEAAIMALQDAMAA